MGLGFGCRKLPFIAEEPRSDCSIGRQNNSRRQSTCRNTHLGGLCRPASKRCKPVPAADTSQSELLAYDPGAFGGVESQVASVGRPSDIPDVTLRGDQLTGFRPVCLRQEQVAQRCCKPASCRLETRRRFLPTVSPSLRGDPPRIGDSKAAPRGGAPCPSTTRSSDPSGDKSNGNHVRGRLRNRPRFSARDRYFGDASMKT